MCRVRRAGLNGVCRGVLSLREWKRRGEPPLDQKGGLRVGLGWEFLSEGRSGAGWGGPRGGWESGGLCWLEWWPRTPAPTVAATTFGLRAQEKGTGPGLVLPQP